MTKTQPLFEQHANATLDRAKAIYANRGNEYGDTWRQCNFIKMKAVARELGLEISDEKFRALATAGFCDMKYWRLLGGFHDDSLIDGINYDAFLAQEMRDLAQDTKTEKALMTALLQDALREDGRIGDWFLTYTGKKFWPVDPRPEDICIEDIAHHLSLICRFGGATSVFYSVAQHSLLVESIHPGLQSLMHDATEAYVGDMVRPLKLSMPEYRAVEQKLWAVICKKYGISEGMHSLVKRADNIALMTERRDFIVESNYPWSILEKPLPDRITPTPSRFVEAQFLKRFKELTQ